MNFSEIQPYVLPVGLVSFFLWRYLKFKRVRTRIPLLLSQGAVIVDVRSSGEFMSGANPASISIPLDRLEKEASHLDSSKPVILCCASGTRSAMAASLLKKKGFKQITNAGSWNNTVV